MYVSMTAATFTINKICTCTIPSLNMTTVPYAIDKMFTVPCIVMTVALQVTDTACRVNFATMAGVPYR